MNVVDLALSTAGKQEPSGKEELEKFYTDLTSSISLPQLEDLQYHAVPYTENHPVYERLAAVSLLLSIYEEVSGNLFDDGERLFQLIERPPPRPGNTNLASMVMRKAYERGVDEGILAKMPESDGVHYSKLEDALASGLITGLFDKSWAWESKLSYAGLTILRDRYLLRGHNDKLIETPSLMFMRIARALCSHIDHYRKPRSVIRDMAEFYETMAELRFMPSTPTLFNAGLKHQQLSSCYLTTIGDSIEDIYKGYSDNARLSKFAGGLGNDWTPVRAMGARINGTNGKSQGIIPFLKVANDSAVAVNQSGKRLGAVCAYLEVWHYDIEEFIQLRKNDGASELRRTHEMHTAVWVPDLFMEKVFADKHWYLFSPEEEPVKGMHDAYGEEFVNLYERAVEQAESGNIKVWKKVKAVSLWRDILNMLYQTGHPWICFKDPSNMRSPLQHVGNVHSSNLCTEITLPTSKDETSVCNLGSLNLAVHIDEDGDIDLPMLKNTIWTAIRMLDRVIDINYYPIPEARKSNMRHRPIGLGIMGWQDLLWKTKLPFDSVEAANLSACLQRIIYSTAVSASSTLAHELGAFPSFYEGDEETNPFKRDELAPNTWRRFRGYREKRAYPIKHEFEGLLKMRYTPPSMEGLGDFNLAVIDEQQRDMQAKIREQGIRNSNLIAIAPTATIATICGVTSSIEPCFTNIAIKSNLSGDYTMLNTYMVRELEKLGLWNEITINRVKADRGSIQNLDGVPDDIKRLFKTSFELDQHWLILAASMRAQFIDQSQSLNLYVENPTGPQLDKLYKYAWRTGLKTTYYLRTRSSRDSESLSTRDFEENAAVENM